MLRVFVLSVLFLSDFVVVVSCAAAVPLCPVRAVSVPEIKEGYKCVCRGNYYGTNCRFKGKDIFKLLYTLVSNSGFTILLN
jgi:hypothetical protein